MYFKNDVIQCYKICALIPEAAIGCIPDEMQKGPDKPRF